MHESALLEQRERKDPESDEGHEEREGHVKDGCDDIGLELTRDVFREARQVRAQPFDRLALKKLPLGELRLDGLADLERQRLGDAARAAQPPDEVAPLMVEYSV